jgi:hypothetical protein
VRYQLASMGEEFITPDEKAADHPIVNLLERYTQELKREDYLSKYHQAKHPQQVEAGPKDMPTYVGSEKCKNCHTHAYDVWKDSAHAHAYDTLVEKARRPSLRQHDAECIICHTVGFGYVSGYENETKTAHLKHVGCESCHGPGSQHVKNWEEPRWQKMLNPWKTAQPDPVKLREMSRHG